MNRAVGQPKEMDLFFQGGYLELIMLDVIQDTSVSLLSNIPPEKE
jgi:hypothetical protein